MNMLPPAALSLPLCSRVLPGDAVWQMSSSASCHCPLLHATHTLKLSWTLPGAGWLSSLLWPSHLGNGPSVFMHAPLYLPLGDSLLQDFSAVCLSCLTIQLGWQQADRAAAGAHSPRSPEGPGAVGLLWCSHRTEQVLDKGLLIN